MKAFHSPPFAMISRASADDGFSMNCATAYPPLRIHGPGQDIAELRIRLLGFQTQEHCLRLDCVQGGPLRLAVRERVSIQPRRSDLPAPVQPERLDPG